MPLDNQSLIGNWNQRKKSLSELWLKLETSFSPRSGVHEELRMALVTPRHCYPNRAACAASPEMSQCHLRYSLPLLILAVYRYLSQLYAVAGRSSWVMGCPCSALSTAVVCAWVPLQRLNQAKWNLVLLSWSRRTSMVTFQNVTKLENVVNRTCF